MKAPTELLEAIAKISLNWGQAENFAGDILADIYKLEREAASDLIYAIDLRKKIDLIVKNSKAGAFKPGAAEYVKALEYANKHYRKNRNIVAHGMFDLTGDANEPGVSSFMRDQYLTVTELQTVLDQSRYALSAVLGIMDYWCGAGEPEPLPPKPPELPPR